MIPNATRRILSGADRITRRITHEPAMMVGRDLRIRWVGGPVADMLRSSPEVLRGRPLDAFVEAIPAADDYGVRIKRAIADRSVAYAEDLFHLKNDPRPLGVWIVPVFCALRSAGALLLMHDMGVQRTAERELAERTGELRRRSEELERALSELARVRDDLGFHQDQLTDIFDGMDEGIIVCDPESRRTLFANRRFREMFGDAGAEAACTMVGACAEGVHADPDISALRVAEWRDTRRERQYRQAIRTIRWPDGRWVRFARITDVTDDRTAARVDSFSIASVPMAVVDPVTGEIKEVNRRLELLTGIPAAQLIQTKTWPALLDTSSAAARSCNAQATGNLRALLGSDSSAGMLFSEPFIACLRDAAGRAHRVRVSVSADGQCRTAVVSFEQLPDTEALEQQRVQALERCNRTLAQAVNALASTVVGKDTFTAEHQRKVAVLACAIAMELEMPSDTIHTLRVAGLLHDIGKIHIPDTVLNKADRLDAAEQQLMRTHPLHGYNIIRHLPFDAPVAEIVRQHHERLDGSGYPGGLRKDDILMESRILAVADVVEAMTARRPWREPPGNTAAINELRTHSGTRYDPRIVDACVRIMERERPAFS